MPQKPFVLRVHLAIASLAELAGVTIGPDGQPLGLETLGDGDILGLFTLPLSLDDSPP